MSPSESHLRSYLQHEAEDVDAHGDLAGAIFAAKRRSDRRRAGGLVALTALAVAAPLAWSSFAGAPSPAPGGSSPAPSLTSSDLTPTTPTAAPTVTSLTQDALVTAEPVLDDPSGFTNPGIPYAVNGVIRDDALTPATPEPGPEPGTWIYPQANTVTTPLSGGFGSFQRLEEGRYLVQATSGSDQRVHLALGQGESTVLEGAGNAVVSADRRRIAWTDGGAVNHPGEGVIHISDSSGAELTTVKVDATPTALVGDILYGIKVLGYDFAGKSVRIDLTTGARTEFDGNVVAVHAGSGLAIVSDLVTDAEPETPRDRCFRLLDTAGPSLPTRLRVCGDMMPFAFSPDGRSLLARGGDDRILVVDASDGRVLLDAIGSSGLRPQAARVTDDGVAVVMSVTTADLTRNGLVRCTLTGRCEQVGGPSVEEPAPDDTETPRTGTGVAAN